MRSVALLLLLAVVTSTGCYFGRSKNAKVGGYAASGFLLAIGGTLTLGGTHESDCYFPGCETAGGPTQVGGFVFAAGVLGLALNALVEPPASTEPASGYARVSRAR